MRRWHLIACLEILRRDHLLPLPPLSGSNHRLVNAIITALRETVGCVPYPQREQSVKGLGEILRQDVAQVHSTGFDASVRRVMLLALHAARAHRTPQSKNQIDSSVLIAFIYAMSAYGAGLIKAPDLSELRSEHPWIPEIR